MTGFGQSVPNYDFFLLPEAANLCDWRLEKHHQIAKLLSASPVRKTRIYVCIYWGENIISVAQKLHACACEYLHYLSLSGWAEDFIFHNGCLCDEYANPIPHPVRKPKYTKVKVSSTQDKQHVSWAASQNYAATAL